jgi:hypothetical protein
LFHASAEKSEPTVATANAHRRGILRSPAAGSAHETFPSCPPARKHTDRRPTRERTFAAVKTFWRRAPFSTLVVFHQVRRAISRIATTSSGVMLRNFALKNTCFEEMAGMRTPRYFANATATAAIVPVWITRRTAQPYRNPPMSPQASRRYTYCPPAFGKAIASLP